MKVSLKTKATLLASALVVGVLAVVGLTQYSQLGDAYLDVLQEQQDALATTVAGHLSDKIETQVSILEQSALAVGESMFTDVAQAQDYLSHQSLARNYFDGIAIVGLDGEVVANHPPIPPGGRVNIRDRDYFVRALAGGRWSISDPVQARSAVGPTVVLLVPVRNARGQLIGFAGGGLLLQRANLLGALAQSQVGRGGHFEIVTRGAAPIYVVHPDPARLLAAAPAVAPTRDSSDVVTRKALRNVDWELRVVLPGSEARAPIRQAESRLISRLAVIGAATALLVWLGMHVLLRPLSTLHSSIRRLRESPNAELHLDTHAADERGDLAREFEALMHELHARQAELAAVTERSPLGFFRANTDGLLTYVNDAYLQMHGLARNEAANGWLQQVGEEARADVWQGWLASVKQAVPFTVTRRTRRPDGSERLLIVRSAPVIADGQTVAHVGTVADITERANQEKALRLLTTIFDTTSDYVVQTDARGFISYMNPAARRLFGIAADATLAGRTFAEFSTEASNEVLMREMLPGVRGGGVWIGETTVIDSQRREVPVSHMVIAHRDKSGRIEHFSAVLRDLSSEASARRAAQLQAAMLRTVAETIPAMVAVIGADERYRFVNATFQRWFGARFSELEGRTMADVLGEAEYQRSLPWVERALAGETVSFEKELMAPADALQNHQHHLAITFIPMRGDRPGKPEGFVSVAYDITQHRVETARLQELAQRDALTGLLNRAGFEEHLAASLLEGGGPALALLYIDLDHFKPVNDRHGHAAGDQVLKQFAERLQRLVRPTDAVARLGGDEFAVVLAGLPNAATASAVADKVVAAARTPFTVDGIEIQIGASVGVAFGAHAGERVEHLVSRADELLYVAKRSGRGQQMTLH